MDRRHASNSLASLHSIIGGLVAQRAECQMTEHRLKLLKLRSCFAQMDVLLSNAEELIGSTLPQSKVAFAQMDERFGLDDWIEKVETALKLEREMNG